MVSLAGGDRQKLTLTGAQATSRARSLGRSAIRCDEDGKPRSTGDFVRPEKVPPYPC